MDRIWIAGLVAVVALCTSIALVLAALATDEWITFCGLGPCPESCGTLGFETGSMSTCGRIAQVNDVPYEQLWPLFPAENNFGNFFNKWSTEEKALKCGQDDPLFATYGWGQKATMLLDAEESALRELSRKITTYYSRTFDGLDNALANFWTSNILKQGNVLREEFLGALDGVTLLFAAVEEASKADQAGFSIPSLWTVDSVALTATGQIDVNDESFSAAYFGSGELTTSSVAELFNRFAKQEKSLEILKAVASSEEQENKAIGVAERLPSLVSSCSQAETKAKDFFAGVIDTPVAGDVVLTTFTACVAANLAPAFPGLKVARKTLELCGSESVKTCAENKVDTRLPENLSTTSSKLCRLALLQDVPNVNNTQEFQFVNVTDGVDAVRCTGSDLIQFMANLAKGHVVNTTFPGLPFNLVRPVNFALSRSQDPWSFEGYIYKHFAPRPYTHLLDCARLGLLYNNKANSCRSAFSNPVLLEEPTMDEREADEALAKAEKFPETRSSPVVLCGMLPALFMEAIRVDLVYPFMPNFNCSTWSEARRLLSSYDEFRQALEDQTRTQEQLELFATLLEYDTGLVVLQPFRTIFPSLCTGRTDCFAKAASQDAEVVSKLAEEYQGLADEGFALFYPRSVKELNCSRVKEELDLFKSTKDELIAVIVLDALTVAVIIGYLVSKRFRPVLVVAFFLSIACAVVNFWNVSRIVWKGESISMFPSVEGASSALLITISGAFAIASCPALISMVYFAYNDDQRATKTVHILPHTI